VDQFTREWLEADRSMTGMKVVHALEKARAERGSLPTSITVDNGSEFCSRALEAQAGGERIHREFQWPTAGRLSEHGVVFFVIGTPKVNPV